MRRRGDKGSVLQERSLHQIADLQFDHLARCLIDEIALGQGDDAVTQTEQAKDFQMFARLRHDGIVGRHHEDGQVDAGGAGQHVLDETLVAGHIDDAEAEGRQIEDGEADIDGDAAGLLFRQTIAVDAGQGLDERGFAVVDVSGGAEDQVAGHGLLLLPSSILLL